MFLIAGGPQAMVRVDAVPADTLLDHGVIGEFGNGAVDPFECEPPSSTPLEIRVPARSGYRTIYPNPASRIVVDLDVIPEFVWQRWCVHLDKTTVAPLSCQKDLPGYPGKVRTILRSLA